MNRHYLSGLPAADRSQAYDALQRLERSYDYEGTEFAALSEKYVLADVLYRIAEMVPDNQLESVFTGINAFVRLDNGPHRRDELELKLSLDDDPVFEGYMRRMVECIMRAARKGHLGENLWPSIEPSLRRIAASRGVRWSG